MEDALSKLAVFRQRVPGGLRTVYLEAAVDNGLPPLAVQFVVPDGVQLAQAEAAAATALSHIRQSAEHLGEYGLQNKPLSEGEVSALARIITAVESAALLWKDWNYAEVPTGGGEPVKQKLTRDKLARVLSDSQIRGAWLVHLDQASPLERAEGNVSAASLNGSSEEAANTAKGAELSTSPAPEA